MTEQQRIAQAISDTFRTYGFEGTSLSRLTASTGLIKASLYHRFPEGKQQMADLALAETDRIFVTHVLAPIDEAGEPSARLEEVCRRLLAFYANGRKACLLETLTVPTPSPFLLKHARRTLAFWTGKFAQIGRESGVAEKSAWEAAQDAIAALEGALVVVRVTGRNEPFLRAIASLPSTLTVGRADAAPPLP